MASKSYDDANGKVMKRKNFELTTGFLKLQIQELPRFMINPHRWNEFIAFYFPDIRPYNNNNLCIWRIII